MKLRVRKLTIIWLLERLLQNFWENKICPAAGESSPALMKSNGNPSLRVSRSARRVRSHLLLNFFRRHDAEQQSGFLLIGLYDLTAKIRLSAKTLERETIKKASNPELWRSISSSKSDYNILCRPKRTLMQASVRKPTLKQNNILSAVNRCAWSTILGNGIQRNLILILLTWLSSSFSLLRKCQKIFFLLFD